MKENAYPSYFIRVEGLWITPVMMPTFCKTRREVIKRAKWLVKHGAWEKAEIWDAYELRLVVSITK